MTIIHQPTFFYIEILLELEPIERYGELFSPLPIEKVVALFDKDHRVGRPVTVNYEATFKAFVVRYIEGIPTIKALIKRLKEDLVFKLSLGFLYSERIPSEATFSRFAHELTTNPSIMDELNQRLLTQIDEVNGLFSEQIALDATHVTAHDKARQTDNDKLLSVEEQLKVRNADLSHLVPTEPT